MKEVEISVLLKNIVNIEEDEDLKIKDNSKSNIYMLMMNN